MKRTVFWIDPANYSAEKGYRVSQVTENVKGHVLTGSGFGTLPYFFGHDLAAAEERCYVANEKKRDFARRHGHDHQLLHESKAMTDTSSKLYGTQFLISEQDVKTIRAKMPETSARMDELDNKLEARGFPSKTEEAMNVGADIRQTAYHGRFIGKHSVRDYRNGKAFKREFAGWPNPPGKTIKQ